MKEKNVFFNPIRMISPKLDMEAARLEEMHKAPVSDSFTLEEGLVVMLCKLIRMTRLLQEAFARDCPDEMEECQILAEQVHKQEKLLTANLVCSVDSSPELCRNFILFPGHLERVGDFLESILNCCRIKCAQNLVYTDQTYAEVKDMFDLIIDMLTNFRDAILVPNQFVLEHVIKLETSLEEMCHERHLAHVEQLLTGAIVPRSSSPYLEILDSTESIGRHVREMAEKILSLVIASRAAV